VWTLIEKDSMTTDFDICLLTKLLCAARLGGQPQQQRHLQHR